MNEYWDPTAERLYCPLSDTHVAGETLGAVAVSGTPSLESWLEEVGPQYAGEPMFDWSIDFSWRLGDPLGLSFVELDDFAGNDSAIRVRAPFPGGRELRLGGNFSQGRMAPWAAYRQTAGVWLVEVNSEGRLAVGAHIPTALTARLVALEGMLTTNVSAGTVGVAASGRIMSIGAVGEASVGWGRGAELLTTYLGAEIDSVVTPIVEWPYRYPSGFDLR